MNLIRKSIYPTLWSELFDNRLDAPVNGSEPAVNIRETADDFSIELAAPGMKKDDFKVEVENDLLTISSEKEHKNESENEGYSRKEFSYTSFSRSFNLPKSVLGDQITATYEDGILKLRLPKREEAKLKAPRLVKIS